MNPARQLLRRSIRVRLTLWNASVLAFVLGVFALAAWITLTTTLRQRTDAAVRESARVVAALEKNVLKFTEVRVDSQLSILRMMVLALMLVLAVLLLVLVM